MAAASYNTDLTDLVADSSSTGDWAALGGGGSSLGIETDYFIEGTRCVSKGAWASDTKGMVEDTTNTGLSTGSGKAVYTWVTHHTSGSLAVKSSGGITILLGSASNTLNRYFYAGSDTIDYGAPWICAVVDPDEGTQDSGTVTVPNMDTYGAEANLPSGGPTKGSPFGIDEIRYGHSIEVNDGVGAAATFTALAADNDSITNRWGQFQRTPGSTTNFTMQCRLEFGDTTNTTACEFTDSNKNITINDLEHVATDFIEFDVTQASDVDLTGIIFTATAGGNTRGNWVSTSSSSVALTSCNFANFGTSDFDGNTTITGCTFRECDQVTQAGATITGSTIDSSTNATALVADTITELTGNTFISDGTGHAVDLGNFPATETIIWDNTLDDGTGSEWTGSDGTTVGISGTANDALLVDVDGGFTLTISVAAGATIPTVRNVGTGTVTISAGEVTLLLTVKDINDSSLLEDAMVYVTAASGGSLSIGTVIIDKELTNVSGIASDTRSYASDQPIEGRIRLSTIAPYYKTAPVAGTIDNVTGLSLTIQMIPDE